MIEKLKSEAYDILAAIEAYSNEVKKLQAALIEKNKQIKDAIENTEKEKV